MLKPDGNEAALAKCKKTGNISYKKKVLSTVPSTDRTPPAVPVVTIGLINSGTDIQLTWNQVFDCN